MRTLFFTAVGLCAVCLALGRDQVLAQPGSDQGQPRILRSSEILGMRVWDSQYQRIGTVKDVVVELQAGCPTLFVALSEVPQVQGYVVVPFDVMQLRYDNTARTDFFVLNIAIAQLRDAPRIEGDRWDTFRDRQFLGRARQFYQRVEHRTARPEGEHRGRGDGGPGERRPDTGNRPHDQRPDPKRPDDRGPDANRPDDRRPDAKRPDDRRPGDRRPDDNRPGREKEPRSDSRPGTGNLPGAGNNLPGSGPQPGQGNPPNPNLPGGGAGQGDQPKHPTPPPPSPGR